VVRQWIFECSAQPSGSAGEQVRLGRTVAESKEADVVETVVLCGIGFAGILKGGVERTVSDLSRVDGRCKRPRNHATPIASDEMERLRANGVGDSKDIRHGIALSSSPMGGIFPVAHSFEDCSRIIQ
jgi:hypothetical protein